MRLCQGQLLVSLTIATLVYFWYLISGYRDMAKVASMLRPVYKEGGLPFSMQCIDSFRLLLQRYVRKGNDAKNSAIFSFSVVTKTSQRVKLPLNAEPALLRTIH